MTLSPAKQHLYVDVAVSYAVEKLFTYSVPSSFLSLVAPARRVWISFNHKEQVGVIINCHQAKPLFEVLPIIDIIDNESLVDEQTWKILLWVKEFYCCFWGEVLNHAIPFVFDHKRNEAKKEYIYFKEKQTKNIVLSDVASEQERNSCLNDAQEEAAKTIINHIFHSDYRVFVLHEINPKVREQIYSYLIDRVQQMDKGSIIINPDRYYLNSMLQSLDKLSENPKTAILHSEMPPKERIHQWNQIRDGKKNMLIGLGQCVLAPIKQLGLIVIDRADEYILYLNQRSPRYYPQWVSIQRMKYNRGVVILGTSIPSLEMLHLIERKRAHYLPLNVGKSQDESQYTILDMKKYHSQSIFTIPLCEIIEKTLAKKKQAVLIAHYRGFQRFLKCPLCHQSLNCPHCQIPLRYYINRPHARCHYCYYVEDNIGFCRQSACSNSILIPAGAVGVEQCFQYLTSTFPDEKITSIHGKMSLKEWLESVNLFNQNKASILICTPQKLPYLTFNFHIGLIAILDAYQAMNIPSLDNTERLYKMINTASNYTQYSQGLLFIQEFINQEKMNIITWALQKRIRSFYKSEISFRRMLKQPPAYFVILIEIFGNNKSYLDEKTDKLSIVLEKSYPFDKLIGPLEPFVHKIKNVYYKHIMLSLQHRKGIKQLNDIIMKIIPSNRRKSSKSIAYKIHLDYRV